MTGGATLREMLEREFPVDDLTFPWGTEVGTVEATLTPRLVAAGRPAVTRPFGDGSNHGFGVLTSVVLGIPVVRQTVWAPSARLPVIWITFDLAPDRGLEGAAGLARVRGLFDRELDEVPERGLVASGRPNPHGVAAQWTSGSTTVHLFNTHESRHFLDGRHTLWSAGSLRIERDERALLQPYSDAKLRPQPWDAPGGDVTVIDAPGLQTGTRGSGVERWVAVHEEEYVTPQWVADRMLPGQVAIWQHPGAGVWGFGDARISRVLPTGVAGHFELTRIRAARGSGRSVLPPCVASRGPAGLDAAAQALARRGAQVRVTEADD